MNLDAEWGYRRLLPDLLGALARVGGRIQRSLAARGATRMERFASGLYRHYGPQSRLARTWATSTSVLWIAVLLFVCLLLYYS